MRALSSTFDESARLADGPGSGVQPARPDIQPRPLAEPDGTAFNLHDLAFTMTCNDGTEYRVRPICPADGPGLAAFHHRLSIRSVYLRFFSCRPELSAQEIERFTCVDYRSRLALVAEINGELIAVGRYDCPPQTTQAEVAFVVADDYQHHGIGSLLLDELAQAAWQRGIRTFVASTLAENRTMLEVFFHSGFTVSSHRDSETISIEFPIEPDEQYRSSLCAREWSRTRCYGEWIRKPEALAR